MTTEDYVSFETAKLLEEKGFDANLHYYYDKDGNLLFSAWSKYDKDGNLLFSAWSKDVGRNDFLAPTLQMAMKWLREKHNIVISIVPNFSTGKIQYGAMVIPCNVDNPCTIPLESLYPSYEKACEAGIKYCLENLI